MSIYYVAASIIGAAVAIVAAQYLLYPPPDINGIELGLLAAAIIISGAALGAIFVWAVDQITRD